MQESMRLWVFNEVCFFKYGLYMFCVACMLSAYYVAVNECDGSLFLFLEQEGARQYEDVCVF